MSTLFDDAHRIGCECITCQPDRYSRYCRPQSPFQRNSETSRDAADRADVTLPARQRLIVSTLTLAGRGLTREEISDRTDIRIQSVCSAVAKMLESGVLCRTNETRKTSSGSSAEVVDLTERC